VSPLPAADREDTGLVHLEAGAGRLLGDGSGYAERMTDVLAVHHDLAEHGHDLRWPTIRRRGPGTDARDYVGGVERPETAGVSAHQRVEPKARLRHAGEECRHGLLGAGKDVRGGQLDRPRFAQRLCRPLIGSQRLEHVGHDAALRVNQRPSPFIGHFVTSPVVVRGWSARMTISRSTNRHLEL
jgi:hypothetical protein